MTTRVSHKAPVEEQTCFSWIAVSIPCFSREATLPIVQKEGRPSTEQLQHGSVLWGAGSNKAEMLHVVFPELPTARAFFDRFIADTADFSILEGDLAPWNDHMVTSDGEMEPWTTEQTRKMSFLSYPIPPGFVPFKKYILKVEHSHRYQFVIDESGAEVLQFEAQIQVNQDAENGTGKIPYADCFTMRQLWTVRPIPNGQGKPMACELDVIAEINFIGRPPLLAPVIQNRALSEHRGGTQGWLRGARACLDGLPATVAIDVDAQASGESKSVDVHHSNVRNACPLAWLTACLICLLWITFRIMEVMPSPVKMSFDPTYSSLLLSVSGLGLLPL